MSLIFSNLFFFYLFGAEAPKPISEDNIPEGWVEVQLQAELLTPFQSGKKVLIIHRTGRKKIEGVLQTLASDPLGKVIVLVKEAEAHALFQHDSWEVLPYLKHLSFATKTKGESHEIRY